MTRHRIAVVPGDGIGKEVIPEGIRVVETAASRFGIELEWCNFDWSCETYHRTGRMMPEDGIDQLRDHAGDHLPHLLRRGPDRRGGRSTDRSHPR